MPSGNTVHTDLGHAALSGGNLVKDPGAAGTFNLEDKSLAFCSLAAATTSCVLPNASPGTLVILDFNAATTVEDSGAALGYTGEDGTAAMFVANTASTWKAVTFDETT